MSRGNGRLSYLAIATIFLVVMGTMWAGMKYSEGELLDREEPTELESQLRGALWTAVTDDADTLHQDTGVWVTAQGTAKELAAGEYFDRATAVGLDGNVPEPLAKTKGLCARTIVKLTVTDPGWNGSSGPVPDPVARDVAERVSRLLAERGERISFSRAIDNQKGIGVAVRENTVFAVFRTCNLGY